MDEAGLEIVQREDAVDVREALERRRLLRHERDRPALAAAVRGRRRAALAQEVPVGGERHVDTARAGEAVPLPQPRVDLDQLEHAVARIALPLDLRDSVEAELAQQP